MEPVMGLNRWAELVQADDPEETTETEKEEINQKVIQDLLNKHDSVPPISPIAVQTHVHLRETARWALAMNDVYDMATRRLAAQKKVAEHHKPTNPGTGAGDDEITLQAVQKKVRRAFDGRYGRKNAQEHFDEVLEDIETTYQERMETR